MVVLTHSLWTKRFGGRHDVLGQTVRLDGRPHTVIGVLAPGGLACLDGSEVAFVPLAAEKIQDGPGVHYYQVIARLKPGVSVEQSQAAMTVLADALAPEESPIWRLGHQASVVADGPAGRLARLADHRPAAGSGPGDPSDRLRQHGQPVAFPGRRTWQRDRDPDGGRRRPLAGGAAVAL